MCSTGSREHNSQKHLFINLQEHIIGQPNIQTLTKLLDRYPESEDGRPLDSCVHKQTKTSVKDEVHSASSHKILYTLHETL